MADKQLVDFVRAALEKSASRADIAKALSEAGWPTSQIDDALSGYADVAFPAPVPKPQRYLSAREAFLYLVLFILLGIVATNLGVLGFQLINVAFADPATATAWQVNAVSSAIRWCISALVISFPLFLFLSMRLNRERKSNPGMQRSRLRKWLTYLTLVIAAMVLIGDLMSLVFQFLGGELTMRFTLKMLVIALIAGTIFLHYVRDAERDEGAPVAVILDRVVAGLATFAVLGSVIAGWTIMEKPGDARARTEDDARMAEIRDTAGAIDCHFTMASETPADLGDLESSLETKATEGTLPAGCFAGVYAVSDLGDPLEYIRGEGAAYQLCTSFRRATTKESSPGAAATSYGVYYNREFNALHPAGRHCFSFTAESLNDESD